MYHVVRDRAADRAGASQTRSGVRELAAACRHHWRWCAALAILPVLAACGDDHHHRGFGGGSSQGGQQVTYGLVAADFQGTGRAQVLATSTVQRQSAGNPGNLQFFPISGPISAQNLTFADGNDPLYLAQADLNGDGLPDVVSASSVDGALDVFMNSPGTPGTFGLPIVLPSQGASQVAILDMTGDGLPDIVSADFNVSLFVQLSPGNFAPAVPLYQNGANWVSLGDLNGDGQPDVALTDGSGLKVLLHSGAASATTFAAPVTVYTPAGITAGTNANIFQVVVAADVNGDGLTDLVVTDPTVSGNSDHAVVVLLQDPANHGSFLAPVAYAIQPGSGVASMLVSDVNGDGRPDIVVGGSGGVSVLLQDPATAGTFQSATVYTSQFANEISVADVDGDGLVDIIVSTGPAQPVMNNVQPNAPGVLLQNIATPGTFLPVQAIGAICAVGTTCPTAAPAP